MVNRHKDEIIHAFECARRVCDFEANWEGFPFVGQGSAMIPMSTPDSRKYPRYLFDCRMNSHNPRLRNPRLFIWWSYRFSSQVLFFGGTTKINRPGFINQGLTLHVLFCLRDQATGSNLKTFWHHVKNVKGAGCPMTETYDSSCCCTWGRSANEICTYHMM